MPRQPRIEFEGAVYHILARGNRKQRIFVDDADRNRFLESLGQACGRLGWEVRAWVLMGNHYHLALHTPSPNLVEGMRWLQNAYTRYFNTRHDYWGHLFGGRYKSVLVDPTGSYQRILIDYIHLNPARAGMVGGRACETLLDFRWSSLAQGYALPPSRRPPWLETETGFRLADLRDTATGRRRYVEGLERRAASENAERAGTEVVAGQTLHSSIRRGWYWGGQAFRERVLKSLPEGKADSNRNYRSSPLGKQSAIDAAESVVAEAIAELLLDCDAAGRPKFRSADPRRGALAWVVWNRSSVPQAWIAERIGLSSAANVSQQMRRFDAMPDAELPATLRQWRKKYRC